MTLPPEDAGPEVGLGAISDGMRHDGMRHTARYCQVAEIRKPAAGTAAVLNNRLLDNGLPPLGEGKDGFAPPF